MCLPCQGQKLRQSPGIDLSPGRAHRLSQSNIRSRSIIHVAMFKDVKLAIAMVIPIEIAVAVTVVVLSISSCIIGKNGDGGLEDGV